MDSNTNDVKKKSKTHIVLLLVVIIAACFYAYQNVLTGNNKTAYNLIINIADNFKDPTSVRIMSGTLSSDESSLFCGISAVNGWGARRVSYYFISNGGWIMEEENPSFLYTTTDKLDYEKINKRLEKEFKRKYSLNSSSSISTVSSLSSSSGKTSSYSSTPKTGNAGALAQAQSYIRSSAFSRQGLIDQLIYHGFSESEAIYGADRCGADWKEQAKKSAQSYTKHSAFSYSGLIEQLEYEGFTSEQAKYGADKCGANWNEQAAKSAKSYLKTFPNWTRSELIDQLRYEGFSYSEAQYGADNCGK